MEDGWPSGVGLRGQAPNRPVLRWLKTVVVSDREKAHQIASGGGQGDVPERLVTGVVVEASLTVKVGIETGRQDDSRDELGGYPSTGQAVPGVEAA